MFDTDTVFELTEVELAEGWLEADRHALPADLESIPPGPLLATILSTVDRSKLNGHDSVRAMVANARMESFFAALKYESMAEVAHSTASGPEADVVRDSSELEFGSEEIGSALSLTRRAANSELGLALSLQSRIPAVARALREGHIDVRRARVFDRETIVLEPDMASDVCDRLLASASELTTGQLRARLARFVIEVDPEGSEKRTENAVEERRMLFEPTPEGVADLHAYGIPVDEAARAGRHVNGLAYGLKRSGDDRSIDQLRVDVMVDLLQGKHLSCGNTGKGHGGGVHITATLDSLARLSETPGELAGYGPVYADITRRVIDAQHGSEWKVSVTDDDGHLIHVGTTKRRPTKSIKRIVETLHSTCVFVGCRMDSVDCDIDHRRPWHKGGVTCRAIWHRSAAVTTEPRTRVAGNSSRPSTATSGRPHSLTPTPRPITLHDAEWQSLRL